MRKALLAVAFFAACSIEFRDALAVQTSFTAGANATVQPLGPRTGANGINFFNLEGSNNLNNSSYGVIDFVLSNSSFGGPVTGINSITLNLVESNAAFTNPGNFSVYVTSNTTTSIANTGTSPLFFTDSTASGTVGTATVGPTPPSPDSLLPLTLLGSFNFTTTGNTNNGQIDSVPLTFAGSALTDLLNRINSNSTLRLVLTPDDPTVAATFGGAGGTAANRQTLVIDANVAGLPYWDVNGSAAGLGGTGTWDTTTPNFNDSTGTGTATTFDPSKLVIFAGTAPGGTITVAASGITENGGLQFNTDGYVIQGGPLTVGTNNTVNVGSTAIATINSKVSGSNGLTKLGTGTLVLGNSSNDFTGTVTVGGGTLQISSESNLGPTTNALALSSGGLLKVVPATSLSLDANRTLTGSGGGVDVGAGNIFTVNGNTNMTGPLSLPSAETVILAGGQKVLGGVTFGSTGTLRAGTGTDTIAMNGTITANNATGTSTINGNLDFGGTARSIAVAAGGTLVVTGGITANGPTTGHVSVSGGGTLDVQGDNSQFLQPITIGSAGVVGPTVFIHDQFGLGFAPFANITMFFNSGTASNRSGSLITFNTHLLDSIGSTTAQPAVFTGVAGGDYEFQGAVNLFRPATGQNGITVNNNTTFSGGWIASIGTATNLSGVLVNGTGTLTLSTTANPSGSLGLDVPLSVGGTVTVNINAPMTSSAANVTVSGGTVKLGLDDAINTGASLTVSSGTFNMNSHNQTVAGLHLVGGTVSGVGNTLTSTTDIDAQGGTINANLAGAVGLIKTGTGAITLSGSNTYSGTTTVNNGTLTLTGTLTSPTLSMGGGTLAVNNGAAAVAFGSGTTLTPGASSISGTTTGAINLGAITRNAGATLNLTLPTTPGSITTTTANTTFAGGSQTILGGYATVGGSTASATWAVSGSGSVAGTISGLAVYSPAFAATANVDAPTGTSTPGSMTINSLRINGAGAATIADSGGGDTLTVATGGILETTNVGANAVTINVANLATGNGQDLVIHQYNTNASGAMTIASQIAGSIGLTKTGGGNVILSTAKTFSGNTVIGAGTLTLGDTNSLQNSTVDYSYGGTLAFGSLTAATLGGLKGTNNLALGAVALSVGNNNTSNAYSGVLSGTGRLIKIGTGTEILTGANTYSGAAGTTISGGILQIGNGGTTGSIPNIATSIASGAQLVFNRSNALTFSGVTSGAGTLTQLGSGTTTLSGANTYTGTTNINGGKLNVGVAEVGGGTPSGPLGVGGTISFGGGALQYSSANKFDYSPRFSAAAGQLYSVDTNGQAVTWAGNLTSSGGSLTKAGTGTLTLTGANTYTGGTNINAGTLAVGSPGAIGSTGTISFGGGTLQYTAGNNSDYSSRLSTADAQPYRVDPNGRSVVWTSNLVSNNGSLAVTGTNGGSLDLQGDNSGLVAASGAGSTTLGTVTTGGPTLIVHNPNSLGVGEFRFNGGTLQAATPIVFGSNVSASIGAAGSTQAPAATFSGANTTFQGPVSLFKSGGNSSRITVNNNTTFAGGFGASTGTGADGALFIAGTGALNLSGGIAEDLPITVDTATVNVGGNMTNNAAGFKLVNGGKVNGQVDNALPTASTLTLGDATLGTGGTYSTGGHNQNLNNLIVQAKSTIDFGTGASVLQINPSTASQSWAGILRLNNWTGNLSGNGTDQLSIFSDGGSLAGLTPAQLAEIHFTGFLTGAKLVANGFNSEVVPASSTTLLLGDINQDHAVNTSDVTALLSALTDLNVYQSAHPTLDAASMLDVFDTTGDGKITNADIQGLLNLVSGSGSVASVPEPASIWMCGLAVPAILLAARRWKRS